MRKLSLDELGRVSVEEFQQKPKIPIIVVLDNIRSALNVGSVFRTSDGFGIEKVILTGITAQPPHREINKTAIGATESMAWEYFEDILDATSKLKNEGYQILIAEQTDGSIPLDQVEINANDKLAIVVGNEVNGVSDALIAEHNTSVEIPQHGTKHSFNVAVSTGILLWELRRKLTST